MAQRGTLDIGASCQANLDVNAKNMLQIMEGSFLRGDRGICSSTLLKMARRLTEHHEEEVSPTTPLVPCHKYRKKIFLSLKAPVPARE